MLLLVPSGNIRVRALGYPYRMEEWDTNLSSVGVSGEHELYRWMIELRKISGRVGERQAWGMLDLLEVWCGLSSQVVICSQDAQLFQVIPFVDEQGDSMGA